MQKQLNLNDEELYFIPLGGSEQFGVNFNLYCYKGKWIAVDCGIGFANHRYPGIDILLPDPRFLEERKEDLLALFITHAHEDHIGAVAHLWPRLKCPIYCSDFTASVLKRKLNENPECRDAVIHPFNPGDIKTLEPFELSFIHIAHSIPHNCSLTLKTDKGIILHSGDWNLDPSPVLGKTTDVQSFKNLGKKGVLAYIGDSTNSPFEGRSGSEATVETGLYNVFKDCKGKIIATLFASNVSRIQSIARAAEKCGRSVVIAGRSLHTMVGAAKDNNMLEDINFVSELVAHDIPDDNLVYIVTGSQGEARAMLARIARGDSKDIKIGKGDNVVFSARPIPGNEEDINEIKNLLTASGVNVIAPEDTDHHIHVSGHPCAEEVIEMYQWVKPKTVIPVHGERLHLEAQAKLAHQCQIKNVIVPNNGSVIRVSGKPEIIDHIETGLLAVERNRTISSDHVSIRDRRKLQYTGVMHATLYLSQRGDLLEDPILTTIGLVDNEDTEGIDFENYLIQEIEDILRDIDHDDKIEDQLLAEKVRIAIRRIVIQQLGFKPKTTIHIVRG
jgi:ribonuclease J